MKIINDITDFIFLEHEPKQVDIIFIAGSAYPEIAEKAAELWNKGYSKTIIPSGRYSVKRGYFPGAFSKADIYDGNYNTEWEFLKDVLVKNGVEENSILKEDKAENTYENALMSKSVTDRYNLNIKKAIICCKSFHARRCLMYYQLFYPQTKFFICPVDTQGVNKENWFQSDDGIDKVMGELMRCGGQFKDIIKPFIKEEKQINYQIEEHPAFKVIGVSHKVKTAKAFEEISKIWGNSWKDGTIKMLSDNSPDLRPSGILGIYEDGKAEEMEFIIGVTNHVESLSCKHFSPLEGTKEFSYPAATWAIFQANGEAPQSIQRVYKQFYNVWLPSSGYERADLPVIECYMQENNQEVWFAVVKK